MAKTIEERAKEYANEQVGGEYHTGFEGVIWQESYERYKEIATEQHERDIDKAWKWIEWMLGTQSATPDFVEESHNRFKQTMEEE